MARLRPQPEPTPTEMPAASGMRPAVAAIDYRPRHSGGGCTLCKQTPRPAAVASPMGQMRTKLRTPPDAAWLNPVPIQLRPRLDFAENLGEGKMPKELIARSL
jgi:hypothetical protein